MNSKPGALQFEAARFRLGLADGRSLAGAAADALVEGRDSRSLAILAGEDDPLMSDAAPLFLAACDELGVPVPELDSACWILVRHHVSRIVEGEVSPFAGVGQILAEVFYPGDQYDRSAKYVGDSLGIERLIGSYWEIYDIGDAPGDYSGDGKFGAEAIAAVEEEISGLAADWLRDHGSR